MGERGRKVEDFENEIDEFFCFDDPREIVLQDKLSEN